MSQVTRCDCHSLFVLPPSNTLDPLPCNLVTLSFWFPSFSVALCRRHLRFQFKTNCCMAGNIPLSGCALQQQLMPLMAATPSPVAAVMMSSHGCERKNYRHWRLHLNPWALNFKKMQRAPPPCPFPPKCLLLPFIICCRTSLKTKESTGKTRIYNVLKPWCAAPATRCICCPACSELIQPSRCMQPAPLRWRIPWALLRPMLMQNLSQMWQLAARMSKTIYWRMH